MKLALTSTMPSPELGLLAEALLAFGEVTQIFPWNPDSHTAQYDIAVCVGPVKFFPLAKKRILFVFGQTSHHPVLGWDAVVVTSEKAKKLALHRFGYETRVRVIPPFLAGLNISRRRLIDPKRQLLHVSEGGIPMRSDVGVLTLWSDLEFIWWKPDHPDEVALPPAMFSLMEFNSRVKAGAIGFYPSCMEDGYDVQVRRHLALGGTVVCRRDREVLGDLADLCVDKYDASLSEKIKKVDCGGSEEDYQEQVVGFLAKV